MKLEKNGLTGATVVVEFAGGVVDAGVVGAVVVDAGVVVVGCVVVAGVVVFGDGAGVVVLSFEKNR